MGPVTKAELRPVISTLLGALAHLVSLGEREPVGDDEVIQVGIKIGYAIEELRLLADKR